MSRHISRTLKEWDMRIIFSTMIIIIPSLATIYYLLSKGVQFFSTCRSQKVHMVSPITLLSTLATPIRISGACKLAN